MKITTLTWKSKIKVNPKHRDCFCSIFPYPSTQYRPNRSHVHHPHICPASHRTEVNQIKFLPSDLPPLTRRQALHHSRPNYVAISKSNNGHSLSATTVPPISSLDSESELCRYWWLVFCWATLREWAQNEMNTSCCAGSPPQLNEGEIEPAMAINYFHLLIMLILCPFELRPPSQCAGWESEVWEVFYTYRDELRLQKTA